MNFSTVVPLRPKGVAPTRNSLFLSLWSTKKKDFFFSSFFLFIALQHVKRIEDIFPLSFDVQRVPVRVKSSLG